MSAVTTTYPITQTEGVPHTSLVPQQTVAVPKDVSIDVLKQGSNFVCHVSDDNTKRLIVVTPAVNCLHAAIELAREMYRLQRLILTPEMDATWGTC